MEGKDMTTDLETQPAVSAWDLFSSNESLSEELLKELIIAVRSTARERELFRNELESFVSKTKKPDASASLKVAQSYYALGDYQQVVSRLDQAGSGQMQDIIRAKSLRALKDYEGAIKAFSLARDKGRDSFEVAMLTVDCHRMAGQLDQAQDKLKSVAGGGEIRAEYHYQLGRLNEANGLHEEAMDEYDQAIELDANHTQALFYLAYGCDLYGDETEAITYYKRCIETSYPHVNALLNLAVLYEENCQYHKALNCVSSVLEAYPNQKRARLFLKDISSSFNMLYDEEQEQRIDRHNQVLEIPITDFELSVRSRNCLKKMNIRTLGDLLNVTEAELLTYKNFGETSLVEIKQILNQKSLRLGQMLEDHNTTLRRASLDGELEDQDNEALLMPLTDLDLSIRARKCLQRLNMETVGELIKCTEAELLGCKNFGQMSLDEIKDRLEDKGFSLRVLEE
jgi:DNA-directed RNA polymerase subunit alpha